MRSTFFFQLSIIILTFTFLPSPLLPLPPAPLPLHAPPSTPNAPHPVLSPAPLLSCSPYVAPLLITYRHAHYPPAHAIVLTAVFNPDDILLERSFYTRNGRSWHTDIIPGDAACPAQIRAFLDYTLGTLNTGSPPFRYTQGHDLTAYTDFLRQAHRLCSEQAMRQTRCRPQRLYLPVLRVAK